jgi:hypothetical protein
MGGMRTALDFGEKGHHSSVKKIDTSHSIAATTSPMMRSIRRARSLLTYSILPESEIGGPAMGIDVAPSG